LSETIQCSTNLPASPEHIYRAWLSSQEHGAFSGGAAEINPALGGRFTAWDGYIEGTTLELEQNQRIVQAWRTSEFPAGSPDSHLEILLEAVEGGTRITLKHSQIPDGQGDSYAQGWADYYFKPMREYFNVEGR
jgi:activator of HSP90 ATPase